MDEAFLVEAIRFVDSQSRQRERIENPFVVPSLFRIVRLDTNPFLLLVQGILCFDENNLSGGKLSIISEKIIPHHGA